MLQNIPIPVKNVMTSQYFHTFRVNEYKIQRTFVSAKSRFNTTSGKALGLVFCNCHAYFLVGVTFFSSKSCVRQICSRFEDLLCNHLLLAFDLLRQQHGGSHTFCLRKDLFMYISVI